MVLIVAFMLTLVAALEIPVYQKSGSGLDEGDGFGLAIVALVHLNISILFARQLLPRWRAVRQALALDSTPMRLVLIAAGGSAAMLAFSLVRRGITLWRLRLRYRHAVPV